ncbi:MAG: YdeI/OmpD-associated family protein [Chthoniobacterales bacterium]|nr:YdeI/OmpD-associated family protein [Chthoniobacterales bacterium]
MKPIFFATPAEFRDWLEKHHQTNAELWVGFYRKASGRPSITWPESVDEALCVGWIDGIRKGIDETSYMIRFTPRKRTSTWSEVNIGRVAELTRRRRMQPAGLKAFERRLEARSGIYAYEQRKNASLDPASEKAFRQHQKAWEFWENQAPWYRRRASWWIISAKREETRQKRLARLISESEAGRRI